MSEFIKNIQVLILQRLFVVFTLLECIIKIKTESHTNFLTTTRIYILFYTNFLVMHSTINEVRFNVPGHSLIHVTPCTVPPSYHTIYVHDSEINYFYMHTQYFSTLIQHLILFIYIFSYPGPTQCISTPKSKFK